MNTPALSERSDPRSEDQTRFDDLWAFLTSWHERGTDFNPGVRSEMVEAHLDYEPFQRAMQEEGDQRQQSSEVFNAAHASTFPEWFLRELHAGDIDNGLQGIEEDFPGVFEAITPAAGESGLASQPIFRLERYRILSRIGHGGMGVVFKAHDPAEPTRTENLRAVKLLRPDVRVPENEGRLGREAAIVEQLQHPNIVRLYQNRAQNSSPYFVMEYVYGPTLDDLIAHHNGRPVPFTLALDLIHQIADALAFIKSKNCHLVHRDLKPANILLKRTPVHSRTPSGWEVKIADFGLAKEPSAPGLTEKGTIVATPSYAAPEVVAGEEVITPAADVYSLGLIAYQLLTGKNPFEGDTFHHRTARQDRGIGVANVQQWNPSIPDRLSQLVEQMMRDKAADRPSCEQVLSEIEALLNPEKRRSGWTSRIAVACAVAMALVAICLCIYFSQKRSEYAAADREIITLLDESEWGQERLTRLNDLLAIMATHDQEVANRRWGEFGDKIRDRIARKQRLEEGDVWELQAAIELFRNHDSGRATELGRDLDNRLSSYQLQFQYPGTAPKSLFGPEVSAGESGSLVVQPAPGNNRVRRVVTQAKCGIGGSRLRAEFDGAWLDATEVGIELNSEEKIPGYVFSLHPVRAIDDPAQGDAPPITFRAAREMKQTIELRILHHQVVLHRSRYDAAKFHDGPLAITAARNGSILTLTVDGIGVLKFDDVFALSGKGNEVGRYTIRWPMGARLVGLRAEDIIRPKSPSPLERADELYTRKSYPEALKAYEQAWREDSGGTWRTEIRYKQALCKVRLEHDAEEIRGLFQEVLNTGDERWRPAAYVQLWAHHLKQRPKGIVDADALIARKDHYLPGLDLARLVRRVPDADGLSILEYYRARVPSSHATGLSDGERIRLAQAWVDADEFLFGDSTESKFWLSRAHSRRREYAMALSVLDSLSQRDTNFNVLTERIWLLRRLGHSEKALTVLDTVANSKHFGNTNTEKIILSVLRAECYADQNHWDLVVAALDPQLLNADLGRGPERQSIRTWLRRDWLPRAWLMRGFARTSRDSQSDVQTDWENACRNVDEPAGKSGLLAYVISRSLAGISDEKDVNAFLKRVREERDGSVLFAAADQALKFLSFVGAGRKGPKPEDIMKDVVREMWRTEEGRKRGRMYAFRTWGIDEQLNQAKALAACEFLRQHAFFRSEVADQWAACWAVAEMGLRYASDGGAKIELIPIISAWLGQSDQKGIDVLFDTIPVGHHPLRAPAAYVLAHRMLSLNRPNSTKEAEYYLGQARKFADHPDQPDPHLTDTLKTLIETDLRLLKLGNGILVLKNDRPGKIVVSELKDGKPIRVAELAPNVPTEMKAGHYRIEWDGPGDVNLTPTEVRLGVCRRQTVRTMNSK
jgi:hypothetical protein